MPVLPGALQWFGRLFWLLAALPHFFVCADGRRAVHGSGVAGVDANGEPAEMLSRFRDSDADCLRADGVCCVCWVSI